MKSPVFALCLSAIISLPMQVIAAETSQPVAASIAETSLNDLFRMRLAAQRSIGGFYMFNSQERDQDLDQRYAKIAKDNLAQAVSYVTKLPRPNTPEARTLLAQIQSDLSTYSKQLNQLISTLTEHGYADLQLTSDLAALSKNILQHGNELELLIAQEQGYKQPELTKLAREQSLLMQNMAADYAARSASIGGSFFAGGEKQALDQLSEEFAQNLLILADNPKNTDGTRKSLRAIQVKWRYIESSLKNYNEDSVPFVIDKYARSITQGLEQLAAQYALLNI